MTMSQMIGKLLLSGIDMNELLNKRLQGQAYLQHWMFR